MRKSLFNSSKKAFALLLSALMIISLAPAMSFAAYTGDSAEVSTVVSANKQTGQTVAKDDITISKEISKEYGTDNQFDITLKAVLKGTESETTSAANVVLVVDRSAQMDVGPNGQDVKDVLKEYVGGFLGANASDDNQLALVSFAENAKVEFGLTAKKDYKAASINGTIDAMQFKQKGSFIQDGIKKAQELLDASKAAGNQNAGYIILVSAGYPTYSYMMAGSLPVSMDKIAIQSNGERVGTGAKDAYTVKRNFETEKGTVSGFYCQFGFDEQRKNVFADPDVKDGNHGGGAYWQAAKAKQAGTEIYSIHLKQGQNAAHANTAESLLKAIASDNSHYNAFADRRKDNLKSALAAIQIGTGTKNVVSYPDVKTVTDPLPEYVSLQNGSALGQAVTVNGQNISWDLSTASAVESTVNNVKNRTYTLTYTVKVDPNNDAYRALVLANGSAPLNGTTTLSYVKAGNTAAQSMNFPVPTVKTAYLKVVKITLGGVGGVSTPNTATFKIKGTGFEKSITYSDIEAGKNIIAVPVSGAPYSVTEDQTSAKVGSYKLTVKDVSNISVTEGTAVDATVQNKYETVPVVLTGDTALKVTKKVTGNDAAEGFAFELKGADNATLKAVQDGEIVIAKATAEIAAGMTAGTTQTAAFGDVTFKKTGTYKFSVKETTTTTADGWTYDNGEKSITVVVTNDNGQLKAAVTGNNATVENKYEALPVVITGNTSFRVTKKVTGNDAAEGFAFELKGADAATLKAVQDGDIVIAKDTAEIAAGMKAGATQTAAFGDVTFKKVGTYQFNVKETTEASVDGWTYDNSVKSIKAIISDNNGRLSAAVIGNNPIIENKYETVPVVLTGSTALKVTKKVTGNDAAEGFAFELKGADDTTLNAVQAGDIVIAKDTTEIAAGMKAGDTQEAVFGDVTFKKAGTYQFNIKETTVASVDGWTYDNSAKSVTVVVTDRNSQLSAAVTGNNPTIENTYATSSITVNTAESETAFVKKTVAGVRVHEREFEFTMSANEGAPIDKTASTVNFTKAETKAVDFGSITYDKPGTYTYTVQETSLSGLGWTCDNTKKTVTVVVSDNGNGRLSAVITPAEITNSYQRTVPRLPGQVILDYALNDSEAAPAVPDYYETEFFEIGENANQDNNIFGKNPERAGYTFAGWYEDEALTDPVEDGEEIIIEEDCIVYAKWDKIPEPKNTPELNKVDHYAYIIGYPDGTVQPQNNITRAEVVTIFFRMLTEESRNHFWKTDNTYSDVNSTDWFNNAVSTMENAGVIKGYGDGTFLPGANITRAEFAVIASRFAPSEDVDTSSSSVNDIDNHWAKDYVQRAEAMGYIKGYEDGTFRPDRYITRAEAVTIVNRVLGRMNHNDGIEGLISDGSMKEWSDNMDTSVWYYTAVQEATNSHEYKDKEVISTDLVSIIKETWTKILPPHDWVALEQEWSSENGN